MARHSGRLELTWTDKEKTLLSTGDGRYDYTFVDPSDYRVSEVRLMHEADRIEAPDGRPEGSNLPEPTIDNLMITGDSMHVLDALAKIPEYSERYLNKVKLVYIDPPFNTGQAFTNYEDNIEHSIWLTMLRDRLRQIMPLLADDGSVWVHLDDVEVHRCRAVMDEELGPENFIAEVIWQKIHARNNSAQHFSADHDFILVYAKSAPKWRPNRVPRTAKSDGDFWNPDSDPRGPWRRSDLTASKPYNDGHYEVVGPHGDVFKPRPGRPWGTSKENFDGLLADNRIWWGKTGRTFPFQKRFQSELGGLVPNTVWLHEDVGNNREAKGEISALLGKDAFATPKPERLLQRIIHIATNPGDIVLDCYAGSGTTAAVAHKMGRRWVTSELLPETAENCTIPRLRQVVQGEDMGGVSTATDRVALVELPDSVTPDQAKEFTSALAKISKQVAGVELDKATLKALRDAGKTKDVTKTLWHGGGGFTHLVVGPSMFEVVEDFVCLADWATHGDLARAMCAQLEVRYSPDGIFAAKKGRVRFVVLDGLVGDTTIASILEQLGDKQIVQVWATQYVDSASDLLRKERPGSRLEAIPESVLDRYRRKAAKGSPFKKEASK